MEEANITGVECRFAVHCVSKDNQQEDDLHLVKETIHYSDGTKKPNIRLIKNYERPFYVTKKGMRNHQQKKEWELIDNVMMFKSTEKNLQRNIQRALGKNWFKGSLRDLHSDPYIYGSDILSTVLIKEGYKRKYPQIEFTMLDIGVFDVETDVLHGTKKIVMATFSHKEKCYTAVTKDFISRFGNVQERLVSMREEHLLPLLKGRKVEFEVKILENDLEVLKYCMEKAHERKPDLLAAWNIEFDMTKIIETCEAWGIPVEDILSDPSIPKEYRHFKFKVGAAKKVTASGKIMPYKPAARWHTVFCPSSFYWVDAMCIYKQVRTGSPDEEKYSLDYILNKRLGNGKLSFKQGSHLSGLAWHKFMQEHHPLEYIVYNQYDCISVEMLDEKTLDMALSFPMFSGFSDFQHFNSQPRRKADDLHFVCLREGRVVGTTAAEMKDELTSKTLTPDGWIVMLDQYMRHDNGLRCIEENPNIRTNIYAHNADLDISAAYPTNGYAFNVSKETTKREVISIGNIEQQTIKEQVVNFSAGHVNAVSFCCTMFNMPTLDQMLDAFMNQENNTVTI